MIILMKIYCYAQATSSSCPLKSRPPRIRGSRKVIVYTAMLFKFSQDFLICCCYGLASVVFHKAEVELDVKQVWDTIIL